MNIAKPVSRSKPCSRIAGMLAIVASLAAINAEATMVVGDENTTTVVTPTNTIITATKDATLTVTDPGEIEILLVGGGGGAGGGSGDATTSSSSRGGGGGGGGVIHKTNFQVGVGTYTITVGSGGAVNTSDNTKANAVGGSTTGFDLTALGGGPGGLVEPKYNYSLDNLGASGGGGSKNSLSGSSSKASPGGKALASAENENMGHAGANAPGANNGGGGGGAGGVANGVVGGAGYACDISGEMVYYGGGGGGGRQYYAAQPGLGGGNSSYGGGGSGQSTANSAPESGGSGIVIVRFTRTEQKTSSDFTVSGFDDKGKLDDGYAYLVITNDTTLHVTGSASFDVLLVGGGGGAGANSSTQTDYRGGGGGGGGVIYLRNFPVAAGNYPIVVGAGGEVNTGVAATTVNGGNTTAFDFTAFGGGPGAPATGYGATIGNIGASGGGGATDGGTTVGRGIIYGGTAKASAENYNLGNAGSDAYELDNVGAKYNGGAGGGAGSAAVNGVGGDGYACDITGETVYYGGGGGGGKRYGSGTAKPGLGGGNKSWGGGGSGQYANSNAADGQNAVPQPGGHGIVIIRYKRHMKSMVIILK